MRCLVVLFLTMIASLLSLDVMAEPQRACCRPIPKWYLGLHGSLVYMNDVDLDESYSLGSLYQEESFDLGYGFSGEIGYRLYPKLRVELEASVRQNNLNAIDGVTYVPSTPNTYSRNLSYSIMTNAYYDFLNDSNYVPYIGVGVGATQITNPLRRIIFGEGHRLKDWVLGYQFMAGVSYKLPSSNMELLAGYRYIGSQDGEVKYGSSPGYRVNFNSNSHTIEAGIRYYFDM